MMRTPHVMRELMDNCWAGRKEEHKTAEEYVHQQAPFHEIERFRDMLFDDTEPLTGRVEPVTSREPCGCKK